MRVHANPTAAFKVLVFIGALVTCCTFLQVDANSAVDLVCRRLGLLAKDSSDKSTAKLTLKELLDAQIEFDGMS